MICGKFSRTPNDTHENAFFFVAFFPHTCHIKEALKGAI